MRFWLSGPRIFGFRPGVSFSPSDLTGSRRHAAAGDRIEGSFVYVVRGDHNMVKIGVTTNPRARLAQLRTGSAFPIEYAFIGITPGTGYDIEGAAHAVLDKYRCAGEWFDLPPEIAVSAVMGAAGKLGQPMRAIDLSTADHVLKIAAGGDLPATAIKYSTMRRPLVGLALYLAMLAATAPFLPAAGATPEWAAGLAIIVFPAAAFWLSGLRK